jgi:uncharacterized RDD family membrane protein YckC
VIGLLVAIACVSVAALLHAPAMMTRTDGRTLGRMSTGIRVVRTSGEPMSFGTAVIREKRALHDIVVDTRVVLDA